MLSRLRIVRIAMGWLVLAMWLPLLIAGVWSLRSRGRLGESGTLITAGAYRYVRHPLYAGLSFTVMAIGLLFGDRVFALGGVTWLLLTQAWSIHEEAALMRRFDERYAAYKQTTPRILPNVTLFACDLLRRTKIRDADRPS